MKDSFEFLKRCLDVETSNVLKKGLCHDANANFPTKSIWEDICFVLGIDSLANHSYESTILKAFSVFSAQITIHEFKDLISDITSFFRPQSKLTVNKSNSNKRITLDFSSVDSLFASIYNWAFCNSDFSRELKQRAEADTLGDLRKWYPYLFLVLIAPSYPKWLLRQKDSIVLNIDHEELCSGMKELKKSWNEILKSTFREGYIRLSFQRLMFLTSFLEVLRLEDELLNEVNTLMNPPVNLPSNSTSSFLRIKLGTLPGDSFYENCAAIIMGVYEKSGLASHDINKLMVLQEAGEERTNLTAIHPIEFSSWQAKIIIERHSLDPLFAIISSLKYSNPSYWAQIYYDFSKYANEGNLEKSYSEEFKKTYLGTLYLEHFFPYHTISKKDVFKPYETPTGEYASNGEPRYEHIIKSGIYIDLIDSIYLAISGFNDSALRQPNNSDDGSFSYIQSEKIDAAVSKNYYKYLSDIGAWRIVKDKFEAELDKRVKAAIADIRHNVKHYVDHLPRQTKEIEDFLIFPTPDKTQRVIKYAHDTNIKIKIALRVLNYSLSGLESASSKDLEWNATIRQLLEEMPNLNTRIAIEYDNGNVSDEILFPFKGNAFFFAQMMQNIIKNAEDHGFKDGNIANPKIRIASELDDDSIYLSFMNNGTPLSDGMSIDKYRTRGLSGKTGNTGLGGAQIDRIIRAHGGEIFELTSTKEWGFILTIKFKLK